MRLAFKALVFAGALALCYGFGFGAHASPQCDRYIGDMVDLADSIQDRDLSLDELSPLIDNLVKTRLNSEEMQKCQFEDDLQNGDVE